MRGNFYGKMAEWSNASVSKTDESARAPSGSNPTLSAMEDTEVGSSHCLENSSVAKTAIVRCDYLPPIWKDGRAV